MLTTNPIYIIYKITCISTGKVYIGQTRQTFSLRWYQHCWEAESNSTFHFHCAIRKHGKNNFIHEILFETTDQNIINEKEIEYIAEYDTYHNGYNMTIGGSFSTGMLGKTHSEKTKLKISKGNKGKKLSKEHKEKLSSTRKGKNNPNYGNNLSEETKIILKFINLGKNNQNWQGYYHTPYGLFESSRLAATPLISQQAILKWCKNSNKIITKASIAKSPYLKSLKESPLGKTFRELGFWFEPC